VFSYWNRQKFGFCGRVSAFLQHVFLTEIWLGRPNFWLVGQIDPYFFVSLWDDLTDHSKRSRVILIFGSLAKN
jgi:hypothetical protein